MSVLDTELGPTRSDGTFAPASVAVVGAGLAGLTVAYRLAQSGDAGREVRPIIFEASHRCGGFIETIDGDGYIVDRGADSMITEKPWGLALCGELGLDDALLATNAACRRSFVARGSRLHPVPEGFHLMAPSRLLPFALSSLLSWKGKLRVALEPLIRKRRDGDADESLASFVRRRLGTEALERIAQPMVGGIYTADPERLSLHATLPRFAQMEREHGSVLRGLAAMRRDAAAAVGAASGPRYELFVSLTDGMEQLVSTLARRLPAGTLNCRERVTAIEQLGPRWRVTTTRRSLEVDAVCLAVPSYVAATLLEGPARAVAHELAAIEHASTATVTLAYHREDIAHPLDGFGFVVPAVEGRTVLACTFSSVKFPGRAPEGAVLLRAFVGGALTPLKFELDDASMTAAVEADLRELLGLRRPASWSIVTRFARSMPQYHVGHLERIARIWRELEELPTLALAGNAYLGAGVPDTIRSANDAAERLIKALALTRAAECRA